MVGRVDGGPTQTTSTSYALFASAMSGRRVSVSVGDVRLAYTDRRTIFVPDGDERSVVMAIAAQGALISAGSLDPSMILRLAGTRSRIGRYVLLEVVRAFSTGVVAPPRHLSSLLTSLWAGAPPQSSLQSLQWAGRRTRQIPAAPDVFGTIRVSKLMARTMSGVSAATILHEESEERPESLDPEREDNHPPNRRLFRPIFSGENPLAKLLKLRPVGLSGSDKPEAADGGGVGLKVKRVTAAPQAGSAVALVRHSASLKLGTDPATEGDLLYPEWDHYSGTYRRAWCRVSAVAAPPLVTSHSEPRRADYRLRRELARLSLANARHGPVADGDDFDVDALVAFAVSRRIRQAPDDRIYQLRRRNARDLGVMVLLDASDSTTAKTAAGSTWTEQRNVAARLVAALEHVGDRVALYGFHSRGRRNIRFMPVKSFDAPFTDLAMKRLWQIEPSGYTRLGAAIRHAAHLTASGAGTPRRLIVVVSDGHAYDDGYEGSYAEHDTRRALDEAVRRGIGCVCISVASATDPTVQNRLWGSVTHARLSEASDIADRVVPMFRAALRAAGDTPRDHDQKGWM